MSFAGLPFTQEEITPELAQYARQVLEKRARLVSDTPPHHQELAVSVSPGNGSDVEMVDVPTVSRRKGKEKMVSETVQCAGDCY
jgi:hypothetical protein